MPNKPAKDTVTVSFTLPRALADAVNDLAKSSLSNKSDVIRRALLAYVSDEDRARIIAEARLEEPSGTYQTKRNRKNKSSD